MGKDVVSLDEIRTIFMSSFECSLIHFEMKCRKDNSQKVFANWNFIPRQALQGFSPTDVDWVLTPSAPLKFVSSLVSTTHCSRICCAQFEGGARNTSHAFLVDGSVSSIWTAQCGDGWCADAGSFTFRRHNTDVFLTHCMHCLSWCTAWTSWCTVWTSWCTVKWLVYNWGISDKRTTLCFQFHGNVCHLHDMK